MSPAPPPESPRPAAPASAPRRWSARKVVLAAAAAAMVVFSLLVWKGCWDFARAAHTPRSWARDAFVLTGEFRGDGSCTVLLDGRPLTVAPTGKTEYEHGNTLGVAPAGFDVHQVSCDIAPPGTPVLDRPSFWVWGPLREGAPLRPGRYRIDEGALERGDTTAMDMALFHARFNPDRAYLVGHGGHVRIVRADSPAVVGSFRIEARRKKKTPFE